MTARKSTPKVCSVEGCEGKHSSHGYCSKHAAKWRKYGDPLKVVRVIQSGCSIDGCERKHYAKSMCSMHYTRKWSRGGDPSDVLVATNGAPFQFLQSLIDTNEDDCIAWPFARDRDGYGRIAWHIEGKKRSMTASRVMLAIATSGFVNEKEAAHACGNGHLGCVNPNHLYWATPTENSLDRWLHGTMSSMSPDDVIRIANDARPTKVIANEDGLSIGRVNAIRRGDSCSHISGVPRQETKRRRLSPDEALAIFNDSRATRIVAGEFGVSVSSVHNIKSGRTWSHVTGVKRVP